MSRWVDLDEQVYCGEMGEYTNYNIDMDTVVDATTIEPSGDLISRADAIELCAEAQRRASTKSELKGISKVWQGLLKLPSTDAVSREEYEVLKEKWIEAEQRADYYDIDGDDEASGYTLPSTDNTQYEWIVEHSGNGWNDWENLICPKCGEKHEKVPYYYNFCPKCGERIGYHKGE